MRLKEAKNQGRNAMVNKGTSTNLYDWRGRERMRGREREYSVFVLNLPKLLDKYGMYGIFQKAGKVCDTYIPVQKDRRATKRYGFVRFRNGEDASRCIKIFHGATVRGSKLIVTEAKPKRQNQRVFQRKLEIQNKLCLLYTSPSPRD